MTASILEETVQGKRIILFDLAGSSGVSGLLTVPLLKGAEGGLGKVGA